MFSRPKTLFSDFAKRPWFSKTLYDLPENFDRYKDLLPIGLRKGFDTRIPDVKLRKMKPREERKIRPIYGQRAVNWISRDDSDVFPVVPVQEMLSRLTFFKISKPVLSLRRPNLPRKCSSE